MVPEKHPANSPEIEERTLVLSRVFDAPRPLVFKAWTQPEHLARWWGPRRRLVPVRHAIAGRHGTLGPWRVSRGDAAGTAGLHHRLGKPRRLAQARDRRDADLRRAGRHDQAHPQADAVRIRRVPRPASR